MNDKQAKALGLLVIDQLAEPVRKLYTSLEAARIGLNLNEPDFSIKCVSLMWEALAEMNEATAAIQDMAKRNGIED